MEVLLPTPESLISEFKPSFISFDENWARGLVAPNIRSWGLISNILLFSASRAKGTVAPEWSHKIVGFCDLQIAPYLGKRRQNVNVVLHKTCH